MKHKISFGPGQDSSIKSKFIRQISRNSSLDIDKLRGYADCQGHRLVDCWSSWPVGSFPGWQNRASPSAMRDVSANLSNLIWATLFDKINSTNISQLSPLPKRMDKFSSWIFLQAFICYRCEKEHILTMPPNSHLHSKQ